MFFCYKSGQKVAQVAQVSCEVFILGVVQNLVSGGWIRKSPEVLSDLIDSVILWVISVGVSGQFFFFWEEMSQGLELYHSHT